MKSDLLVSRSRAALWRTHFLVLLLLAHWLTSSVFALTVTVNSQTNGVDPQPINDIVSSLRDTGVAVQTGDRVTIAANPTDTWSLNGVVVNASGFPYHYGSHNIYDSPTYGGPNFDFGALVYTIDGLTFGQVGDGVNINVTTVTFAAATNGVIKLGCWDSATGDNGPNGNTDANITATITVTPYASVTLGNLNQSYDGAAHAVTATTGPTNLAVTLTYNGSPNAPTNAGSYTVIGTVNNTNYFGSATNTLVISPASFVNLRGVVAWGDNTSDQCLVPAGAGLTNVIAVAAGGTHTLALKSDGTVVAWGDNSFGETNVPAGLNNVTAIAAGYYHQSLALKSNGTVVGWGQGVYGQTNIPADLTNVTAISAGYAFYTVRKADGTVLSWGDNSRGQTNVPLDLMNVTAVAAGYFFNLALKNDGTVVGWGDNFFGQLNIPAGLSNVVAITAGQFHAGAVKADGTVVMWGQNAYGQTAIPAEATTASALAAGGYHTVALKNDSTVTAWGINTSGSTINASGITNLPVGLTNVVAISAGGLHTALVADCLPVSLTLGKLSQSYDGAAHAATVATAPEGLAVSVTYDGSPNAPTNGGVYTVVAAVNDPNYTASSVTNTLIISPVNGSITLGNLSQTYNGSARTPSTTTAPIAGLAVKLTYNGSTSLPTNAGSYTVMGTFFDTRFAGSVTNTLVINPVNGTLTFSGLTQNFNSLPRRVTTTTSPSGLNFSLTYNGSSTVPTNAGSYTVIGTINDTNSVTRSFTNTLVVNKSTNGVIGRRVVAWGQNSFGETNVPAGLTNCAAVAAGEYFTMALRTNGSVVAWGRNIEGQTNVPVNLTNAWLISAGGRHAVAVRTNGTVVAWGLNTSGQTNVPASATNVMGIAAGYDHTLALRTNGTVVAWGLNASGQTNVPTSATNITAIAAGQFHSLALRSNGTVLAWGLNTSGQTNVPINLGNVISVAAGYNHSLALRADGTVIVWGSNVNGQTNTPAGATNVVAIAAGGDYSLVLRADGTLIGWGFSSSSSIPANLTNVIAITSGFTHNVALANILTPVSVSLGNLAQTYTGTARPVTVTTTPSGLLVNVTYNGSTNAPTNAASYTVAAVINETNYLGGVTNTLVISKAVASITFNNLTRTYTGGPLGVGTVVTPTGQFASVTYNGSTSPPTNAGSYTVIATVNSANATGSATNTLVITPVTAITTQPQPQTVYTGSNVSFSVSATGIGSLGYQWAKESVTLTDATNATLTLSNVTTNDAGNYSVTVGNGGGLVTSSNALLTVLPPLIVSTPTNVNVVVNSGSNPCGPPDQFGFALTGPTNLVIVIEITTSLVNPVWTPIATNSLATGSACFSDPQTAVHPQAFYRFRTQ